MQLWEVGVEGFKRSWAYFGSWLWLGWNHLGQPHRYADGCLSFPLKIKPTYNFAPIVIKMVFIR